MSLTFIVTRDVDLRYRGFIGSAMLEMAPGVYVSPRLNRNVRERIWTVLSEWHGRLSRGSIVMVWRAKEECGGISVRTLGESAKDLVDVDNLLLAKRSN